MYGFDIVCVCIVFLQTPLHRIDPALYHVPTSPVGKLFTLWETLLSVPFSFPFSHHPLSTGEELFITSPSTFRRCVNDGPVIFKLRNTACLQIVTVLKCLTLDHDSSNTDVFRVYL